MSPGIFVSQAVSLGQNPVHRPKWLAERLSYALSKRLNRSPPTNIRGHIVGASNVLEAILRHDEFDSPEFFVPPWQVQSFSAYLQSHSNRTNQEARLFTTSQFIKDSSEVFRFNLWFNPLPTLSSLEGVDLSYKIRRAFLKRPYPITLLTHGLSRHNLLGDFYLKLLLEETYPFDSLVCTSHASKHTVRNILDEVQDQFECRFHVRARYRGRIDVVPLCVDTDVLRPEEKLPSRIQARLPQDSFILLFVGKLSFLKADLLPCLHVVRKLAHRNPHRDVLLVVAGTEEGNYISNLLDHARDLGIRKHVKVITDLHDHDKASLFSSADLFIAPVDSIQESFGLAPVEAMACGVPQVVADWSGYRDTVVHGETGFLVPTLWMSCCDDLNHAGAAVNWTYDHLAVGQSIAVSMEKMFEYVQYLMDNEELRARMSVKSRERAVSLYSFKAAGRNYQALWGELISMVPLEAPPQMNSTFGQTRIFPCFSHYASELLDDGSHVNTIERKKLELPNFPAKLASFRAIDEDILRSCLRLASGTHPGDSNSISIGEIVRELCRQHSCHPDKARRHLMWLIKYEHLAVSKEPLTRANHAAH